MNKFLHFSAPFVLACLLLVLLFYMVGISNQAMASVNDVSKLWVGKAWGKRINDLQSTLLVTTLDDELNNDGDCSLREALEAANTNTSVDVCGSGNVLTDTITFDVDGTIVVTTQLSVTAGGPLVIDGGNVITTSGDGTSRVWWVNTTSDLILKNISVVDGYIYGDGAGLYNQQGNVTIANSTFSGNNGNYGGGILNYDGLFITRSTFFGNNSFSGAGIMNWGTLSITNTTFSANNARDYGGGIDNYWDGVLTIENSTFYSNSAGSGLGGGISIYNQDNVFLVNTIIANSLDSSDCSKVSIDGGHNLSSDASCGFDPVNGSMPNTDPMLGPLLENGGPTLTHALLEGSPAIDAGDNTHCPATDQRGMHRPQDGDWNGTAVCDIGAYEVPGPPPKEIFLPMVSKY